MFGRDRRYRRRVAWTLGDYYQQDEWFFDEAERRIQLRRGLDILRPPARFVAPHAVAVSALEAARDLRRSGADATAILDRSVDALDALAALEAAVAGTGTEVERDYARGLVALLELARSEWAAATARAEAEGARALEKVRASRPVAVDAEGHEEIVAALGTCLDAQFASRRAVLARDRGEAHRCWRVAERHGRELDDALTRMYS